MGNWIRVLSQSRLHMFGLGAQQHLQSLTTRGCLTNCALSLSELSLQ
jgi:hypothetical protein